jgi:hypothetical protein
MNFLGVDVSQIDMERFFQSARTAYLFLYLLWVALVWKNERRVSLWGPTVLGLSIWLVTTFPLQRSYGLAIGTDRLRNLWWCATAAAGHPPWESGVVGRPSLEPAWSLLVSILALRDPARVSAVYPVLPALSIVLVGVAIAWSLRRLAPDDAFESGDSAARWRAVLWCGFFVLLASMGPADFMNPYRGFWAKTFLLKPNHALAFALVPLVAALLSNECTRRRSILAAALLGLLGFAFITYWALLCFGVFLYAAWTLSSQRERRREAFRVAAALGGGLILVLPYVYYLVRRFPQTLSLEVGAFPDDPLMSVWGDTPPRAQSLLFLATFDLGANFYLALYGLWEGIRRRTRFDRLWTSLVAGAYLAWLVNAFLLFTGRARQSDEIYFFLVFMVSMQAGLGAFRLTERLGRLAGSSGLSPWKRLERPGRLSAVGFLVALPITVGWWWNPTVMDAHFRMALDPLPPAAVRLGDWIRENARPDDVFLAAGETALWIPALAGRRIVFEEDREQVRALLDRKLVTYVVVEPIAPGPMAGGDVESGLAARRRELWTLLGREASLVPVFRAGPLEIYSIRYPAAG